MALDAALVVRTASAILWLGLGAWLTVRTKSAVRWLGIAITAWALLLVNNNLFGLGQDAPWPAPEMRLFAGCMAAISAGAVLVVALRWARDDGRSGWLPLGAFVAGFALFVAMGVVGFGLTGPGYDAMVSSGIAPVVAKSANFAQTVGNSALALLVIYASLRVARLAAPAEANRWAVFSLAFGLFFSYTATSSVVYRFFDATVDALNIGYAILFVGGAAGAWLWAASHRAGRVAWVVGYLLLGAAILGLAIPRWAGTPAELVGVDPTGTRGVLRTVGWAIFMYGILQMDVLRLGLQPRTISRAALGAGALATLFIVAQIAQNFFSANWGLIGGGVAAGAFLFAAVPIQRAIERMGLRTPTGASMATRSGGSEQSFRAAVQMAYKDRRFSAKEELALAELAQRLGVGVLRATEIRHDVEGKRTSPRGQKSR